MDETAIQRKLAQELLPLQLAARALGRQVYVGECRGGELLEARLNLLAVAIVTEAPLYAYDPKRPGAITLLDRHIILRLGRFRGGGKILEYRDHRPSEVNLAVTKGAISDILGTVDSRKPARPLDRFHCDVQGGSSHTYTGNMRSAVAKSNRGTAVYETGAA